MVFMVKSLSPDTHIVQCELAGTITKVGLGYQNIADFGHSLNYLHPCSICTCPCGNFLHQAKRTEFTVDLQWLVETSLPSSLGKPMGSICRSRVEQPEFSFGIITDIQYADIPDGFSFLGVPRYYRHSIEVLRRAVNNWNKKGGLSFVMNLGDIVDGFCPKDSSLDAVLKVLAEFRAFHGGPAYHILGNHCFYNLPRNKLNEILNIPSSVDGCSYYEFSPTAGFRIVVLDGYDTSAIGWPEGHPHRTLAVDLLEKRNPNDDKNSPIGLTGTEKRFVMFNGGVGEKQLSWLSKTLEDATCCGQKVIIFCHLPVHPDATIPSALLWNYNEVLQVLHRYRCVKACFAGHTHTGGYTLDSHGIHHQVLEAVLECPPGTDAFGHIDVYQQRIAVSGTGHMRSAEMDIV